MVVCNVEDINKNISDKFSQVTQSVIQNQKPVSQKKIYDFDRLKMYFGEPYTVKCEVGEIQITQPTIGDILVFGESAFYSMLNTFVTNPTSHRLQLWDIGIDWNKISDYELFCMFIKGLDNQATKLLFGDVDFQLFELCIKRSEDGTEVATLYNKPQNIELNEEAYSCMAEYLRLMFNIYPKVEKAKGKATKEAMIDEDRINLNVALKKQTKSKSMLLPLISACVNHPGFKYKLNELKEVGIVQFMDSVQRLQIYESTVALNSGMYSGMCDMSKVDKKLFNFMRDIDEA